MAEKINITLIKNLVGNVFNIFKELNENDLLFIVLPLLSTSR